MRPNTTAVLSKDGNSGTQFSKVEIHGVAFARHNQNVTNRRWHSRFRDKDERAFDLYLSWDLESTV